MLKTAFYTIIFVFLLFSASFSQAVSGDLPMNIAFINDTEFYLKEIGIKRIEQAYNHVNSPFNLPTLRTISELTEELKNKDLSSKEREEKETLLKKILDQKQKDFEKREKTLLEPILKDISKKIEQLEMQNNLEILFFDELFKKRSLLYVDVKLDITKQFIADFNSSADKSQILTLNLPSSRIALINTDNFFDKKVGINNLVEEFKKIELIYKKPHETLTESEKSTP